MAVTTSEPMVIPGQVFEIAALPPKTAVTTLAIPTYFLS